MAALDQTTLARLTQMGISLPGLTRPVGSGDTGFDPTKWLQQYGTPGQQNGGGQLAAGDVEAAMPGPSGNFSNGAQGVGTGSPGSPTAVLAPNSALSYLSLLTPFLSNLVQQQVQSGVGNALNNGPAMATPGISSGDMGAAPIAGAGASSSTPTIATTAPGSVAPTPGVVTPEGGGGGAAGGGGGAGGGAGATICVSFTLRNASLTPRQRQRALAFWTRHRDWVRSNDGGHEVFRAYQHVAQQIIDRLEWSPRLERFLTAAIIAPAQRVWTEERAFRARRRFTRTVKVLAKLSGVHA
jgi:hypothetical protein